LGKEPTTLNKKKKSLKKTNSQFCQTSFSDLAHGTTLDAPANATENLITTTNPSATGCALVEPPQLSELGNLVISYSKLIETITLIITIGNWH
jgi:hypothetical protein